MQGRLREEHLSVDVSTCCAHCSRTLDLNIDSNLGIKVLQDTDPMVFVPEFKPFELEDPSIIEAF